jgi:hypothetical protein
MAAERITSDKDYKKSHVLFLFGLGSNFNDPKLNGEDPPPITTTVKEMLIEMLTYFDVAVTSVKVMKNLGGSVYAYLHCFDATEAEKCLRECKGINFGGRTFMGKVRSSTRVLSGCFHYFALSNPKVAFTPSRSSRQPEPTNTPLIGRRS